MTMVDVGHNLWPAPYTGAPSNLTLDAADEIAAQIFRIGKAGTIVRAHFTVRTVTTGGVGDLDIRLETLDASIQPSGTLFGANTNIAHDLLDGDDNTWIRSAAFTGSATVAVGDQLALVIANPAADFGTFNVGTNSNAIAMPHAFGPARATKVDQSYLPSALEYDDGTFAVPVNCYPFLGGNTTIAVNTGTNPDEVGMIFTPQFKMRVIGWSCHMSLAAGADYRVNLYQSGNDTPLLSTDYDGDGASNTGIRMFHELFDDVLTLSAGTTYRLGFLPTTANSITPRYDSISPSFLGLWDNFPGKQAMHYTARNRSGTSDPDAAAWTETTDRRLRCGLIVDQLDDGAGGGSGGVIGGPNKRGGRQL